MKNIFAISIMSLALVGCDHPAATKTEPPPGFKIACDGKGHYAVRMSSGYTFGDDHNDKPYFDSRNAAVSRAWEQYDFRQQTERMRSEQERLERELQGWQTCD